MIDWDNYFRLQRNATTEPLTVSRTGLRHPLDVT